MIQKIDVPIRMRDGVNLSTDIRLPDGSGPFPVILSRTPYNNSGFSAQDPQIAAGYGVVKQDCRGRFDSEGRFNPLRDEEQDGCETIAWIRAQPWCDGRIGMTGGSYGGLTQLAAAWTRPPGLLAITPAVMGRDLFKDLVYYNGVFNLALAAGWGMGVAGRSGQSNATTDWDRVFRHLPLMTMDEAAGYRLPYLREWLAHPTYDDYWARGSIERHYGDFDLPILHAGGWYDLYAEGVTRNFSGIRAAGGPAAQKAQKLIMGPWIHGLGGRTVGQLDFGPQAVVDLAALYQRWLDRWVKGIANGIDREPPVRIFVMGENAWRDENEWPLARAAARELFLAAGGAANSLYGHGALRPEPADGADADRYVYNPDNPVPTLGGGVSHPAGGPTDHAPIERRDDVLVYTGKALDQPLEVTGPVKIILFASSDARDTDFVARLCDVYPDGRSMVLCDGIARTRFREGLDREVMMKPGTVYELPIEMGVTSNVFLPGHRVRLEVTSSCFPRFARNLNTGEPAAAATRRQLAQQTVYHSQAYPSRLVLPVIPRGEGWDRLPINGARHP